MGVVVHGQFMVTLIMMRNSASCYPFPLMLNRPKHTRVSSGKYKFESFEGLKGGNKGKELDQLGIP